MLFQVSFTCCNMSREERKQEELKGGWFMKGILTTASFARLDEGAPESYQTGLEAWRMVFLPNFPAVFCIVELTGGSLQ
jgi:hypothetical protein